MSNVAKEFSRRVTELEVIQFVQSTQSFRLLGFEGSLKNPTALYFSTNPEPEKPNTALFIKILHNPYSDGIEMFWFGPEEVCEPPGPTAEEDGSVPDVQKPNCANPNCAEPSVTQA